MSNKLIILIVFLVLFVSSCKKNSTSEEPILLFKSGFEGDVYLDDVAYENSEDYRYIRGEDSETGFSWPIEILGATGSGMHFIEDDNHQAVDCDIRTVIGHDGEPSKVLYMEENYHTDATQCPYEILNIDDGRKDLYIKYWLKIDEESLGQIDKWRVLFEYKTRGYALGTGFRLIAYIYTDEHGNPYWHFQGDKSSKLPIWEVDNYDLPVVGNEWFKMEFYWKFGNKKNGFAQWKINDEIVAEVHDKTTRNNRPLDVIMLSTVYGNGNPKQQWVDDIEIWEGLPLE